MLALLQGEPGADVVARHLARGAMSAMNLAEVVAKLTERGMPSSAIRAALDGLSMEVHAFDRAAAHIAGDLRRATRDAGLSLGDRACLALATQLDAEVVTADRAWKSLGQGAPRVSVIR